MTYIDETVARLEREKQKASQKANDFVKNEYDDIEELSEQEKERIQKGIKEGTLNLFDSDIQFTKRSFFDNRISMKFPENYFEQIANEKGYIVECNMKYTVNFILNFAQENGIHFNPGNLKKEMKENLEKRKIHITWIEDGLQRIQQQKMAYCLFITKSYKDVFFQYMTFIELKDGFLTLNINGDIKQVKIWEQIIKCMIKTIEIGGKNT
ncbi:MAG TPA: hypothetical protein IAB62_08875 [Candidatus Coprocola pullicola]|nr:hypothetical protein [Candidatus Coprocola pullicola]